MIIFLLAPANSSHTLKWANSLASSGLKVYLFSFDPISGKYNKSININIFSSPSFLNFFKGIFYIRRKIKRIKPNIIHAHYLTRYGFLGTLLNFKPLVVSAWGTDIYNFPKRSFLHYKLINYVLKNATFITSTSNCMANHIRKLFPTIKSIAVVPFGVETEVLDRSKFKKNKNKSLTIGTIKTLEYIYGIDVLIKAFSIVKKETKKYDLSLIIAGEGSQKSNYIELVNNLGISKNVSFLGSILPHKVPKILSSIDIFVALSRRESFGVSILEALSMSIPVITSCADGFREIITNNKTGLIVPIDDVSSACFAIKSLLLDPNRRKILGENGRELVIKKYQMRDSLKKMISIYNSLN